MRSGSPSSGTDGCRMRPCDLRLTLSPACSPSGSREGLDETMDTDDEPYEVVLLPPDTDVHLSPCPSPKLALANIQDFVETTIVLRKDKKNELGIDVTGGIDTYLEQICVRHVPKDGAAYRDGRLRKGDVLLAVNDFSLRDLSFREAVRVLREAPSPLRLLVLRENPQTLFTTHEGTLEPLTQMMNLQPLTSRLLAAPTLFITVELRKASVKDRLGLSLLQRINGRGVFVSYVQPGTIAARHGTRISQGDQVLEINGQPVRESSQHDVAQLLERLDGAIVLLLGRVPAAKARIQEWARLKAQQSLRTRTSTWSAYTGNQKEKLQTQRPSLPIGKESCTFPTQGVSSGISMGFGMTGGGCMIPSPSEQEFPSRDISRNSSIRRSRLSIVAEDIKMAVHESEEDFTACDPLLPAIKVTSF